MFGNDPKPTLDETIRINETAISREMNCLVRDTAATLAKLGVVVEKYQESDWFIALNFKTFSGFVVASVTHDEGLDIGTGINGISDAVFRKIRALVTAYVGFYYA